MRPATGCSTSLGAFSYASVAAKYPPPAPMTPSADPSCLRAQAPKPSPGPHKQRECLPLTILLRNRLKCAPLQSASTPGGHAMVLAKPHGGGAARWQTSWHCAARRYALTGREVVAILMQRHVKVDGKVRTDATYPAGFMDVVEIAKTGEQFRLIYDAKVRRRIPSVPEPSRLPLAQ